MKVTFPLSLKVSLWLLANLLLLATAGGAFYVSQFGVGWESLTRGALGERLQGIGDSIASDLNREAAERPAAILASRDEKYGAAFFLLRNDGTQVAGQEVILPVPIREELTRGFLAREPLDGPPPGGGPRGGRPPGFGKSPPPEGRPKTKGRLTADPRRSEGRFIFREPPAATTWIGLRVPIPNDLGRPTAGTVIIRAPSLLAVGRLLHAGPWIGLATGAFVLSVLFWLPLVGSITRAISRLNRATERIAEGQFDTRVELQRRDELGHLGESVNAMAARLDTLVNGQKRFLGDVAHELGSPIGRLQVATEILETRAGPALHDQVADVRDEVQQMAALVNELLAFTKAGLRPRDTDLAPVLLSSLVQETLIREQAADRVAATVPADLTVRADAALLSRALGNLVRNALRYAGPHAAIRLTAARDVAGVSVVVEDDGPGVPPEALARLGEPFYRPEISRTRESGGVGLGLAIVRSSVHACGGDVSFVNHEPHGFRATLRLAAA